VITNLTHEALEYHGTFEAYRAAKGTLFRSLAVRDADRGLLRTAILNADDPSFAWFRAIPVPRVLTYSLRGEADFRAARIRALPHGIELDAITPAGPVTIASGLLGEYNAANILAAMAASSVLGAGPAAWQAGVAEVAAIPGRMEVMDEGQAFVAIVDFAHTPNALAEALATARQLAGRGRVLVVFGAAGERDPTKRRAMGRIAGAAADAVFLTAEDPRAESLEEILAALADGVRSAGKVEGAGFHRIPDRGRAIRAAVDAARPGDVVIVCGKGHEQSMCFGDTEYPWDDRRALRAALRDEPYGALPTARDG
jgi:UDP-N-acetylmuramoyl-L-alanyl-D-glutamate--2,6-diaminopimelate ligase